MEDNNFPKPPVDKTFIEGSTPEPAAEKPAEPLSSGRRLDVTTLGSSNPYAQQAQARREITDIDMLPDGKEPIPLASGTVAGQLGTGGMARVYKIWNEKLEVFRAVKILLPTQQKDLKNRFETEVKITAKLHHPNIVEIYSVGEWNNLPYLEMELVEGDSLEAIIARYGKLPFSVCSAIAIFVARALVYAHGQEFLLYGKNYHGVIHRDLKPANIMISKAGEVRLMDFGIARPTEASLHTVEGNIVGTMQYLSPEQIDGVDIDCRTDVYSFGAILYEMITGTKTFPQETITNLMKKKIINEYRKFSEFDFQIAPALVKITQKCLQASKEARFPSAGDMLKELEATHRDLTNEDPAQSLRSFFKDPAGFAGTVQKKKGGGLNLGPAFKKPLLPIAVGALVLIVAVGIVVLTLSKKPESKPAVAATATPAVTTTPVPTITTATPPAATGDMKPLSTTTPTPVVAQPKPKQPDVSNIPKQPEIIKPPTQPQQPAVERVAPKETPSATMERLKAKYGTSDAAVIARNAIKAGKAADAVVVLENTPPTAIDPKTKTLLLFEAYLGANRTKDAFIMANGQNLQDAQFDLLCGRLYQALGKNESAIGFLESALTKPSIIRKHNEIRDDALYYTAMVRSDMYRKNPSKDNGEQARNAWAVVKRMYASTPDHPRSIMANQQLSTIK
jgi:eukaryotic-like serine/threonine-protein kinase